MIMLPTRRPDNLIRFIASYGVTKASEPVLVLLDEGDRSFDHIIFPENFRVETIPVGCLASRRANIPFERYPNEPYYAIMGDDIVPLTPYWDRIMKEAAGEWFIAYCDDGIHAHRLPTHPFIGGELVRAQGFVEEPSMGDWYADNCRLDIGRALRCLKYVEEVKYDHQHHMNGKAPYDEIYKKQQGRDPGVYTRWQSDGYYKTLDSIARYRESRVSESVDQGNTACTG